MKSNMDRHLFIKACYNEPVERTPIWVMRQAGRYLPAYQKTRANVPFKTLYRTPELASEVTIQPIEILGFDAAIIFSDILVVPEAMGMTLEFHEGRGPIFSNPLRCANDFKKLQKVDVVSQLDFTFEALRLTKSKLADTVPLIGFCGSPWTLATYMIEGHGSKNFIEAKKILNNEPSLLHELLDRITEILIDYMSLQLEAGADAVQIFDSWGYVLSPEDYNEFSLPYIQKLIAGIKRNRDEQPVIYFLRGQGSGLSSLGESGADVLGLDWTIDLDKAKEEIGDKVALQGNLDPCVLFSSPEVVQKEVTKIMTKMNGPQGHIFNLGHGILPKTPVKNVKALIAAVRNHDIASIVLN